MKKIVINVDIMASLMNEKGFLNRNDIEVITATSNDDVLFIHRSQKVDIIIASLHATGMKSEALFSAIREDKALSTVSTILVCPNNAEDIERSAQCSATVVVTQPVAPAQILNKVQQLMDVSLRESHRIDIEVLINVAVLVSGGSLDKSSFGRSINISTTGLLLGLEKALKKGDQVTCSFFLPGSLEEVKVNGDIVRIVPVANSDSVNYGIKFSSLSAKEKSTIESFIERRSKGNTST